MQDGNDAARGSNGDNKGNDKREGKRDNKGDDAKLTKKPNVWVPHITKAEAEKGIDEKKYLLGTLRVHPTHSHKAYVNIPGKREDIALIGAKNRNRAFHGDEVVVQLREFSDDETRQKEHCENEEDEDDDEDVEVEVEEEEEKEESEDSDEEIVTTDVFGRATAEEESRGADVEKRRSKKAESLDQFGEDIRETMVRDTEQDRDARSVVRGSVVFIWTLPGRNKGFVCTLRPMKKGEEAVTAQDVVVKAIPISPRYPWILIRLTDDLKKMLSVPGVLDKYAQYFCRVKRWNDTSKLPLGHIEGASLGRSGTVNGEINACIYEHGLQEHDKDFSDKIYDHVDEVVEGVRENFEEEASKREDLRLTKRVFTVDPATAKDLDDAIHIEKVEPHVLEVGVHIADVGHFVKTNTPVDIEAQSRTTSVYMPDRVMPMLPHALCNYLCSLNPNEDKLTFSAFYRINMNDGSMYLDGKHKPRFAKTVIRSCCRLNYEEAQEILDNHEEMEPLPVSYGYTWQQIIDDMFTLYDVCGKTRNCRFKDGGITLHRTKMVFHTRGTADGVPREYHLESHTPSHWIIEELMLMANKCVARFLATSPLQDLACLRNHRFPDQEKASELTRILHSCNIEWNSKSSKSTHESLKRIENRYGGFLARTVEVLVMRCGMKPAEYFIVNTTREDDNKPQTTFHYALNFEYYAHFTSPIRRYPDILVHRCLNAILENQSLQEHLAVYSTAQEIEAYAQEAAENNDPDEEGEDENLRLERLHSSRAHSKLRNLCSRSNAKKRAAKDASEMCDRSFFCIYLRALKELWYTNVSVIGVDQGGRYVLVYAAQLGKEKKISLQPEKYISDLGRELQAPFKTRAVNRSHLRIFWRKPGMEPPPPEEQASEVEDLNEADEKKEDSDHEKSDDEELLNDDTLLVKDIFLFGALPIALVPLRDVVPIDYTMLFLSPFHPKYAEIDTLGDQGGGFEIKEFQRLTKTLAMDDEEGDVE
eukprot:GEMP01005646.1.p1 GENE.GEMP01005646.1~~GEMP01005646.1.p1  ORF type:complete len:986 (+),score=220.58 GEMP01005646.1:30-2987(+)